jgi:adenylate cyclase
LAQAKFKRKLSAILSADVAGYGRLMQDDEAATVKTLQVYKQILSDLIKQNSGRVVDAPGDNLLAEFASVVDAVECAAEVQKELRTRNAELPDHRKMRYRIGVNLGDVIQEGDRIYGDGVNIAARLESLSEPGGLCISKMAFDQVETKLRFVFEYIGERSVKNIAKPVGIYRVVLWPEEEEKKPGGPIAKVFHRKRLANALATILALLVGGVAVWRLALKTDSLPVVLVAPPAKTEGQKAVSPRVEKTKEKPAIAVLPFINLSGDPQQDFFGDGIAEDIITDLSKLGGLIVIASSTSSIYKGRTSNIKKVGQELGVAYLLDGSVRKAGNQMRINAQLIDASNGQQLWAERYDGKMDDVFALQDNITRKILLALEMKLTPSEEKSVTDKGTKNVEAYDAFLKGLQSYRVLTAESLADARVNLEKAVQLDPEFSKAYAALAVVYWRAGQFAGLQKGLDLDDVYSVHVATLKAHAFLKKAMKKPTALAYGLMSQIYLHRFLHDKALEMIERALALEPNDPDLYAWRSNILWFTGKNKQAIESANKALRLDPNNPALYQFYLGSAYAPDGDLKKGLSLLDWARSLNPELGAVALRQSIIYAMLGRNDQARETLQIFQESRVQGAPLNLKVLMAGFAFENPNTTDRFSAALVKAGVPDSDGDHCRPVRNNLLTGREIQGLLDGRRIVGMSPTTGEPFSYEWGKGGEFKFTRGTYQENGKYWVEDDVLFAQFDNKYDHLPLGATIFKNPRGTKENKNEYFMLADIGCIVPFATVDEAIRSESRHKLQTNKVNTVSISSLGKNREL